MCMVVQSILGMVLQWFIYRLFHHPSDIVKVMGYRKHGLCPFYQTLYSSNQQKSTKSAKTQKVGKVYLIVQNRFFTEAVQK